MCAFDGIMVDDLGWHWTAKLRISRDFA